jgi:polysaccharide export outer membrane protein
MKATFMGKWLFGAWVILAAGLLQGCVNGSSNSFGDSATRQMVPGSFSPLASTKQGADPITTGSTSPIATPQDYRIGALDTLDIAVLGVADLNRTVQVNSGGTITLPLIRQVQAAGRTQTELERDIADKLAQTYLQSPQVTVAVKEYNSQKLTVDGAVQKPGIFPKQGEMSLLQAIAQAQGLTNYADPTGILVFRNVNGKRLAARFDIRQVRAGKMPDPLLQAGDIVMVDENSAKTTLRDISAAMPLTGLFSVVPLL